MHHNLKTQTFDPQKVAEINRIQFEHGLSLWARKSHMNPAMRFWHSSFKHELMNVVTFSNFDEQSANNAIEAVIHEAIQHNYNVSWWVTPFTQPANLAQLLIKKGFKPFMSCKGLVKDLNDPINVSLPEGIEIKRVATAEQMRDYVDIIATCFGYDQAKKDTYLALLMQRDIPANPQVEKYIAYYYGKPVSTALILIIDNTTTTFYDFATLPDARNKGIGTAMMFFQLKRSQELGAKKEVIIAAPMAQNISKKVGFTEAYVLDMYVFKTT